MSTWSWNAGFLFVFISVAQSLGNYEVIICQLDRCQCHSVDVNLLTGYYNMTVWILARNDINLSMAAGLIRLHMPGVKTSRV